MTLLLERLIMALFVGVPAAVLFAWLVLVTLSFNLVVRGWRLRFQQVVAPYAFPVAFLSLVVMSGSSAFHDYQRLSEALDLASRAHPGEGYGSLNWRLSDAREAQKSLVGDLLNLALCLVAFLGAAFATAHRRNREAIARDMEMPAFEDIPPFLGRAK